MRACFTPLSKHQNVGWIFFLRFFCCENKPTNKHWKSNVITWSSRYRIAPVFIFWNFWVFPSVSLVTQQDKVKWRESGRQVVSSAWWLCFLLLSRPRERESVAYRRPTRVAAASVELSFIETFVAARIETSRVVSVGSLWCSQGPSARTWESGPSKNRLAGKQAETGFCCLV